MGGQSLERRFPAASADKPAQSPAGWRQILKRAWKESKADRVPLVAAGVAFYSFLSLFPARIVAVLIYGLDGDATMPLAARAVRSVEWALAGRTPANRRERQPAWPPPGRPDARRCACGITSGRSAAGTLPPTAHSPRPVATSPPHAPRPCRTVAAGRGPGAGSRGPTVPLRGRGALRTLRTRSSTSSDGRIPSSRVSRAR